MPRRPRSAGVDFDLTGGVSVTPPPPPPVEGVDGDDVMAASPLAAAAAAFQSAAAAPPVAAAAAPAIADAAPASSHAINHRRLTPQEAWSQPFTFSRDTPPDIPFPYSLLDEEVMLKHNPWISEITRTGLSPDEMRLQHRQKQQAFKEDVMKAANSALQHENGGDVKSSAPRWIELQPQSKEVMICSQPIDRTMAHPIDWFVDKTAAEQYVCCVCQDVAHNPPNLEKCIHIVCRLCIVEAIKYRKECPMCRVSVAMEWVHRWPNVLILSSFTAVNLRSPCTMLSFAQLR